MTKTAKRLALAVLFACVAMPRPALAVDKAETVYVHASAGGTVERVSVTDVLTDVESGSPTADVTTLRDVRATDDKTTFTSGADGTLAWTTDTGRVTYKGSASASALPVSATATFTLDGAPVSAGELAGRSGHVTMRYTFSNATSGASLVPFLAVAAVTLPSDVFSNVTATNARVTDGSSSSLVVGYALPGLARALELPTDMDVDLPEWFEIEADATNFSLGEVTALVTPEPFGSIDTSRFDLSEQTDGVQALSSAMDALQVGAGQLAAGLEQLVDGESAYVAGVSTFASKVSTLPDAAAGLAAGAEALVSGISGAAEGAAAVAAGSQATEEQVNALSSRISKATSSVYGASGALSDAAGSLAGVTTATQEARSGVQALRAAIDAAGITKASSDAQIALRATDGLADDLVSAREAAATAQAKANALSAVTTTLGGLRDVEGLTDEQRAGIDKALETLASAQSATRDAAAAIGKVGAETTVVALRDVVESLGSISTANDASTAVERAMDAVESSATRAANSLSSAKNQATAAAGSMGGLQGAGGAAVSSARTTAAGARTLADSLAGAVPLATRLSDGAGALAEGMRALPDATQALQGGATQLAVAVRAAATGTTQLASGIGTLNTEGVAKLAETLDGELGGVSDRARHLAENAEAYDTFTAKAADATGSVVFVYQLATIGA